MLSISQRTLDDDRLNHLINNTPPYSFVLLEDIDSACVSRDKLENEQFNRVYDGLTRVTMSGLLNALDGVASSEDRILFMTTNFIDLLDKALIRPGRVDLKQEFGNCTPIMLELMFRQFFEGFADINTLCSQFRNETIQLNAQFSPAVVQGHLLRYKDDPVSAINNVLQMKNEMLNYKLKPD